MTPVVVPIHLGCCPERERCLSCPPAGPAPTPELVDALIHHYETERLPPDRELRVVFFGGPPPDDALIDAIGGRPWSARIRPDLLSRARARQLADRGIRSLELDAWTFDDDALKAVGRRYRARVVDEQLAGLAALGVAPGIVLAPGLPGTDFDRAVADAERAAPRVRTARVHPVLVLDGSGLRQRWLDGAYAPLTLGQAVTVARAVVDVLEAAGVEVVRVGAQPVQDGLGRPVAGPAHPAFRQLVDARRALGRLQLLLAGAAPGSQVVVRCHPADETVTRGPLNQHVRTLRAAFRLAEVVVRTDSELVRGALAIDVLTAEVA